MLKRGWMLPAIVLCGCLDVGQVVQAEPPVPPLGTVVIVGGVGGLENLKFSVDFALKLEKLDYDVSEFEWTHGKGHILKDLQDSRYHTIKIAELADELRALKSAHPDRPIYLVGRSGGTGLALAAAELLPPQTLERIILLAPAVSPAFDLRPALRATCREIVSFNSDLDWFVLGWGTWQFGTVDRVYTASAGRVGFIKPTEADPDGQELYRRLVQVPWTPSMILLGHTGGHMGTALPSFMVHELVPWLKP